MSFFLPSGLVWGRFLFSAFFVSGLFSAFLATPPVALGAEPSLSAMLGQMLMVGFRGTTLAEDDPLRQALREGKVGGVILFSRDSLTKGPRNIDSPAQLKALTATLRAEAAHAPFPAPLLLAVDQEGGKVQRLSSRNGFDDWPAALTLGREKPDATYGVALHMGGILAAAGINLNFAPCVDIHNSKSPAIGGLDRAFSANPAVVTNHARAFAQGMRDAGVLCALKHFPGHGSALHDTHDGPADVSDTWDKAELEPYRVLLAEGFDGMVMAAHVLLRRYDTQNPASLSPALIDGVLRGELGWQGVVVTDDLNMKAAAIAFQETGVSGASGPDLKSQLWQALNAGADILLYGNNLEYDSHLPLRLHAALLELVEEGRLAPDRVRQSWQRIQVLKSRLNP